MEEQAASQQNSQKGGKGANSSITSNDPSLNFFWVHQLLRVGEPGTSTVTRLYIHS